MTNQKNQTNTYTTAELLPVDEHASTTEALREKLINAETHRLQAEFDPDEAKSAGAFVEDALSAEDAIESSVDTIDASDRLHPCFLDDDGYTEVPPFVTVTNALELYGLKPGETLLEAISRYNAENNDKES